MNIDDPVSSPGGNYYKCIEVLDGRFIAEARE